MAEYTKLKIDYAHSELSTCGSCESLQIPDAIIANGELRIGVKGKTDGFKCIVEQWHHADCFFENKNNPRPDGLGSIEGIQWIRYADQSHIMAKMNISEDDSCGISTQIKRQNEMYHRIYEALNKLTAELSRDGKKMFCAKLLNFNNQAKPQDLDGSQAFLEHLADVMTFGAMENCTECRGGYIFDKTFGYVCSQQFSQFGGVKCNNRKIAPKRFKFEFPSDTELQCTILSERRKAENRVLRFLEMPPKDPRPSWLGAPSTKQILNYGIEVDPNSGVRSLTHVYTKRNNNTNFEYAAILSKTDNENNSTFFGKMQLLEYNKCQRYCVFTHFGCTGKIGKIKFEAFSQLESALAKFEQIYKERTGNAFLSHVVDDPEKYTQLHINYDENIDSTKILETNAIPSNLPSSVQQFVQLCLNTRIMKDMMIEFGLDVEKMSLEKLLKCRIDKAKECLLYIREAWMSKAVMGVFSGLSNRFYSLIPHENGSDRPPIIKHELQIIAKTRMLADLYDMRLAYSLLSIEMGATRNITKNLIDNCYENLKTQIMPLDRSSESFTLLEQCVINTHRVTKRFRIHVEDIFTIARNGEAARYEQLKTENPHLLWYGAKIINFVRILSNGLQIGLPQGRRRLSFGKGIYFTDMANKSAEYCCANRRNSYGFLLVCEVALGPMVEYRKAFSTFRFITRTQSIKGCGLIYPNPEENIIRDGVVIPCGIPIEELNHQSSFKYNEYVVYDEARVNIKYLLKVKFEAIYE